MSEIAKTELRRYLQDGRDAIVWKLEGLSEYDLRRPLTPTGPNLLGLVKHLAGVEAGYFGVVFDRPFGAELSSLSPNAEPNEDMWARSGESRDEMVGLYQRVWAHADATISLLPLDASGCVPWWRAASNPVSLARILVHVTAETHRHAGHADIVRELADGSVGHRDGNDNMAAGDQAWWHEYCAHLESVARGFGDQTQPRATEPHQQR
ncbi:DinB family protein [Arthrobacter sp. H35-D1]|uniref:DinB family protein n=1 Tax=Arthrobacter sp. H35-D1 TaxID=3046202 RepID=UPI0024BB276A|nr:DinB family protein [Arthrobacter sp. H35-D1]MDJ0313323.1 DinB family protein [Arthrobacter sp. H35-D1]